MKSVSNLFYKGVIVAFAAISFSLASCNNTSENKAAAKPDSLNRPLAAGEKFMYQCPMCKDQMSSKPGNCPNCGMKMEKVIVKDTVK